MEYNIYNVYKDADGFKTVRHVRNTSDCKDWDFFMRIKPVRVHF